MKVRKLAVALALAGGLGSGVAQALGLGEVELQSYLNEPLDAQIVLRQSRGVSPGDVFVNVASESVYQRVGLNRGQFASKLKFQVVTRSDGSLAVSVSSREPLQEPYLNFLLELTWPSGRLLREYAVLVDPPVYAAETGAREPLVAASSAGRSNSSLSANSGLVSRSAPAGSGSTQPLASGSVYGPTTSFDTLWSIATRMRPNNSVSVQQVMLAIQDLNPDAFIGGNINLLKRGEVLRAPTLAQIQRLGQSEANQVVRAQNQGANTARATIDASAAATPAAPAAIDGADAELKLIVAETQAPQADGDAEQSGSAGTDGDQASGADAGTAVAFEELDSVRRENNDLNTRLNSLEEQVQTLQRLLELKNSQLADMQQADAETASAIAAQAEQDAQPQTAEPDPVDASMAQAGLLNSIMTNSLYQIVLGGGLLLLLLLLLLVSRRKSKNQAVADDEAEAEADFEQAPMAEPVPSSNAFDLDLGLDDQQPAVPEAAPDVMEEVDSYLAYGQHEQAVNTLESAISREPSRAELHLKLLAVYADARDRVAFERQYGELSALNDDQAMAEADRLLTDLEQAEAAPSMGDLESELRYGSFAGSFGGFDEEPEDVKEPVKPSAEDSIDYDLSGIDGLADKEEPAKSEASEDFEASEASEDFEDFVLSDDDNLSLDEAFLDELDAELDKDDTEAEPKPLDMQEPGLDMQEPDLDKLDLEISDDDLALMGEKLANSHDDDFDFLAGTDEAATKLDLAQVYVEMGDIDGARDILMEVELEGTADKKAEAKELLKNLS